MPLWRSERRQRRGRNEALVRALDHIARGGEAADWDALLEALRESTLVLPIGGSSIELPADETVLEEETAVSVPLVPDDTGALVAPAFTSVEALADWAGETQYIEVEALVALGAFLGTDADRLAIDSGRGEAFVLTRRQVQALTEGVVPIGAGALSVPAGTSFRLGEPADVPPEVAETMRAACAEVPEVRAAYVLQVAFERGRPPPCSWASTRR